MEDTPDRLAVELVPHCREWAKMVAAETLRLEGALGDNLVTVYHIGSTAIPAIRAKPIVDLLPVVRSLDDLDTKKSAIRALGYRWFGELGLPGRRYCYLLDPATAKRIFQLHFYAENNQEIARHLAFRNYLLAHPQIARAYESEKIRAASIRSDDVNAYNDEKNEWIKRVEKDALIWTRAKHGASS